MHEDLSIILVAVAFTAITIMALFVAVPLTRRARHDVGTALCLTMAAFSLLMVVLCLIILQTDPPRSGLNKGDYKSAGPHRSGHFFYYPHHVIVRA